MKSIGIIAITVIIMVSSAKGSSGAEVKAIELGHCGGSCTQSNDCARESDNANCRCSYLTCAYTDTPCGGGCMTSEQCYQWAGGDSSCVCTWWFECEYRDVLKNPGYKPFLKIAAMIRAKREQEQQQHQVQS